MSHPSAPLFSVVTVTFNCADDAEQTARSVLAQDFPDVEYIVQDGGSQDGTPERLAALGVTQIVSAPDHGIYDAMNRALARCRGAYVCFLNAGDSFASSDTLTLASQHIAQHHGPDFLFGDIKTLGPHPFFRAGEGPPPGRTIAYPDRPGRFYLFRKVICHQAWFVRRERYGAAPFDRRYRLLADYAFLLDAMLRQKVRAVHIPQVTVVFDGAGATGDPTREMHAERQSILRANYPLLERTLYALIFKAMQVVNRRIVSPLITNSLKERLGNI